MLNYPQKVFNSALDIIFPKVCLGCGKFATVGGFDYICRKCFGGIELKNTLECIGCKRKTKFGLTCIFCERDNSVDQLIIASELSDPLTDKMIKAYKYKFIPVLSEPLSAMAKKSVKKLLRKGFNLFDGNPLLAAVPLHRTRLNERGFNQSWLIAKEIADTFHISSDKNALSKKYNFKHQADTKSREERLNNVRGNFAVVNAGAVKNRTVILVDDICTTGATLNECARVLKESGARRVVGFVIARGQFK